MRLLTLLGVIVLTAAAAAAQTPPPIQGVTGTIATEGTIREEHAAAKKVAEGAGRVADGAKKVLPGGKGTKQNPLDGFSEGRRVVLQDLVKSDSETPNTTEGVVVDLNRRRSQITVRFADKKTQTLRLPTADATPDVAVSYTDAAGVKVTAEFRRVS